VFTHFIMLQITQRAVKGISAAKRLACCVLCIIASDPRYDALPAVPRAVLRAVLRAEGRAVP